jgi:hypothetical protein
MPAAVVTYRQDNGVIFVHDQTGGIFLWYDGARIDFDTGGLVDVTGVTAAGDFAPILHSGDVRRAGPGAMPKPRPASLDALYTGREDSNWLQAEDYVAEVEAWSDTLRLTVVEGVHTFAVYVNHYGSLAGQALDARVGLEGVCGASFNDRRQLVGINMAAPSWKYVAILKPGFANTRDIPESRISSLRSVN